MTGDRKEIFTKHFTCLYVNFHGSYDINQNPELFKDTVTSYLEMSNHLPTDQIYNFCRYIAHHKEMPLMAAWYELIRDFIKDPKAKTPEQKLSKKEELECQLQTDIITGFWPLFGSLRGRIMVARLYAYICYKNKLELPNYWKEHLVYAPRKKLMANYFKDKPLTKRELMIIGNMIDNKGKTKKGEFPKVGKKVGNIVFGGLISQKNKRGW